MRCGNTRLLSLINATGRSNPVIASLFGAWIRQTEYSADRAGLLCAPIESDLTLRLGELTGMMPYAVNRLRALETFVTADTYRYWMERFERDPLPVRSALGPSDGPVDRRELASGLRRFLAFAIDVTILSVIFHAYNVSVGNASSGDPIIPGVHTKFVLFNWHILNLEDLKAYVSDNAWLWYFPYAAGLVAIAGRTVGMMVLDLRVVGLDHGRVGVAQSVWRYVLALCCAVLVLPLLFGFVRRMQLHDRYSKSRLIGGRTGLN